MAHAKTLFILLVAATPSLCFAAPPPTARGANAYDRLRDCGVIHDDAKRLVCYDEEVAALVAAEKSGEVVLLDQKRIQEVKRQSFGLATFDVLRIISPKSDAPDLDRISFIIASVEKTSAGNYVLRSDDGQVWVTVEQRDIDPDPREGDVAVVTRGVLGSHFLQVGDSEAVHARRRQ